MHDGPPRYLLMRADVLMGALHALTPAARADMLDALAQSTQRFGGQSLAAYAQQVGHERDALLQATASAAAELGWGRWGFDDQGEAMHDAQGGKQCEEDGGVLAHDRGCGRRPAPAGARSVALRLMVTNSPFAAASRAEFPGGAPQPMCAPIRGTLQALAALCLGAPALARELSCAAQQGEHCLFEAVPAGAEAPAPTSALATPGRCGPASTPN